MTMTRTQLVQYAKDICIPVLERAALRQKTQTMSAKSDVAGYTASFLENFCRPYWGIAPILREAKEPICLQIEDESVEIGAWTRKMLLSGTTSGHAASWDRYRADLGDEFYSNQFTTELAGLMVGACFAGEALWDPYTAEEKDHIAAWLYEISATAFDCSWPNNHFWFPMLILLALKHLGHCFPRTDEILEDGLEKLDAFYLGEGWYADGAFGRFDYYVPWAMHLYPLLWCMLETDAFPGYEARKAAYIERSEAFAPYFSHFFDADGAHVAFGRSLSYRFAASSLFAALPLVSTNVDLALCKHIVLQNIAYFKDKPITDKDGVLEPGFAYSTCGHIESYTSDGGAYWCSKAFLCLMMGEDHPFWQAEEALMPIERGAFHINAALPDINMLLEGSLDGGITLFNNTAHCFQNGMHTSRFNDMAGCYSKFAYNTKAGFALSTRDAVALDNTLSLATPGNTMQSQRMGFADLGCKDGVLRSAHTPFDNDPHTRIESFVVPLGSCYHARAHRITLSQDYIITEGGFPLPMWSDTKAYEINGQGITAQSEGLHSCVYTVGSVPLQYGLFTLQPGMHMLAPMAVVPFYTTGKPCPAGEYVFASLFYFSQVPEDLDARPTLQIDGAKIHIAGKTI